MILIVSALFPPEPVVSANLSFDIASELSYRNDVVVITPEPTRPYGMKFNPGHKTNSRFKHVILNSFTYPRSAILGRLRESYSLGRHAKHYIENNHQDIEVIYGNVWPLFAQYLLANTASKYRIPFVIHVQDIYPESLSSKLGILGFTIRKLILPIDRNTLHKAKKIITISEQMKTYLEQTRGISSENITIIRNWQNDAAFLSFKKNFNYIEGNKFCFLYLGSINPTAGVRLLVNAFGKSNLNNACLIIAGNGSDKQACITDAKKYVNDIRFFEVTPDKVPEIQSMADVLLLPLKKEFLVQHYHQK